MYQWIEVPRPYFKLYYGLINTNIRKHYNDNEALLHDASQIRIYTNLSNFVHSDLILCSFSRFTTK